MTHPAPGHGRLEDHRFLTGQGLYTANLQRFGMAHLAVVRSPHAHADIISINVDHAKRFPGVLLVMTGPDWTAAGYGDLQNTSQIPSDPPLVRPPRPVLARDRVRHQGEPVAFVVAKTRVAALDAAEAIAIDYAPLPSVVTPEDAVKENAIQIWDDAPGNICALFSAGDWKRLQPTSMLPHTFSNLLAITIGFQLYLLRPEQQLVSTTEIRTACF